MDRFKFAIPSSFCVEDEVNYICILFFFVLLLKDINPPKWDFYCQTESKQLSGTLNISSGNKLNDLEGNISQYWYCIYFETTP